MSEARWKPIDLTTPHKWYRSRGWRWGDSRWIVVAAFCPTVFGLGGEIISGYGKGFAIFVGPVWLGVAANFKEPVHDPAN